MRRKLRKYTNELKDKAIKLALQSPSIANLGWAEKLVRIYIISMLGLSAQPTLANNVGQSFYREMA